MSRKCDYKMYRVPTGTKRPMSERMKQTTVIHCHEPATRFFRSTHAKMLKVHPTGQWLCEDHYKDQQMMQELYEYLETPEGRRDLFG